MTTFKDRRMKVDLNEMHEGMGSMERFDWMKLLNLNKKVDIFGPAVSLHGNSLSMLIESFSSRVKKSICFLATIRDNFFCQKGSLKFELSSKQNCHFPIPELL